MFSDYLVAIISLWTYYLTPYTILFPQSWLYGLTFYTCGNFVITGYTERKLSNF